MTRTVRIGLTGPIGCGKSTVAGWLAARGAVVIDADAVARAVTAPGEPAHEAVLAHFGDEVRSPSDIREMKVLGGDVEINDRERAAATSLVESLTSEWDPTKYADTYRERVLELVARKAEGERIVTEEPEEPKATVTDLMAVLEASVAEARQRRTGGQASADRSSSDGKAASDGRARYEDMSKDELYEEAKRRDIDGRSSMTKEQLIAALSGELAEAS